MNDNKLEYSMTTNNLGYLDVSTNTWVPYTYTYPYTQYVYPDKFKSAFNVVSKLLEKKIIEKLSVKEFIELVKLIEGTI